MENQSSIADRIHARGRFSGKPGLHRIKALCDALGNPQKKLKFVHLAGTNGKGSTATMIASVMQRAGYKTGLYTSPFLVVFNERIRVNGSMIDDVDLERLVNCVETAEQTISLPEGEHIGEFEFVTAVTFLYFLECGCDIVVLETGLGGEYDATNIIDPPEAAVITSISLDHMAVLGDTVEKIAQAKAGIIKKGSPVVCADGQLEGVMRVLRAAAPDIIVPAAGKVLLCGITGSRLEWNGETYHIGLVGRYQIENGRTALQVISVLRERGWKIEENAVKAGMENASIFARMQILSKKPLIILDGCHNEGGVKAFTDTVKSLVGAKSLRLVIGMVADKSIEKCAKELGSAVDFAYVTQPLTERALEASRLAEIVCNYTFVKGVYPQCDDAFAAAAADCDDDEVVLICGSLYLAGEALRFFAGDNMR